MDLPETPGRRDDVDPQFSLEVGGMLCVGCRPAGRCRFGLRLEHVGDAPSVAGTAQLGPEHEGAGGVAHGGSVMSILDEACGAVPIAAGVLAVTAQLSTRFRRPVPLERTLEVRAWADSRDERGRWQVRAEIGLPGATTALASAEALFVERDPAQHYGRFRTWLDGEGTERAS